MELFQVYWDDQRNLFLEFEKNEKEKELFIPNNIKYINIQFELWKIVNDDLLYKEPPLLISIKKLYHSNDFLSFPIDFDEFLRADDIKLKILKLTIFLCDGRKIEYKLGEKIDLSNIYVNEDCYEGYVLEDLNQRGSFKQSFTHEKVTETIFTDFKNKQERKTIVIEKKKVENVTSNNELLEMIRESNESLKTIANELKNLTAVLENLSLSGIQAPMLSPPPNVKSSNSTPITRIKKPPSKMPMLQGPISSAKVQVIREMKEMFNKVKSNGDKFNIKSILKPMSEKELNAIQLSEEELIKKQEELLQKQLKKLEKGKKEPLKLEDLSKPK